MSILEADFYPTPKTVIRKMMAGFTDEDVAGRTILEPSAGNGNIADHLAEIVRHGEGWNCNVSNIYCVEINAELRMILTEKGYKVVGDDFLTYKKNHLFDLIVMNPPFSDGAAHLLKAWEILNGGDIVCLLNAETVRNPHTRERMLLKTIIDQNGTVEYLGDCFAKAERKTGVDVALVRLKKKTPEVVFDFFEQQTHEKPVGFDAFTGDNLPAIKDTFGNLEIIYDKARECCAEVLRSRSKLNFYLDHLIGDGDKNDIAQETTFNGMIDAVKEKAWNYLFTRTKMAEVMTQKVRDDFDRFRRENSGMDFTKENIQHILETLFLNRGEIMKQCIIDAFEKLTRYDKKNRVHVEGWKTNDAWKVNRRVIIPWGCEHGWNGKPDIKYDRARDLADIEKALCFISGQKFDGGVYGSIEAASRKDTVGFGCWTDSRFFMFKMFKKGTIHLWFKDEWLWKEFNIRAAGYKNWLPDDYKAREKRGRV